MAILRSEFGFSNNLEFIILFISDNDVKTLPVLENIFSTTSDAIDMDFSFSIMVLEGLFDFLKLSS